MRKNLLRKGLVFAATALCLTFTVGYSGHASASSYKNLGKIKQVHLTYSGSPYKTVANRKLCLTWKKSKKATGYTVSYRLPGETEYKVLRRTSKNIVSLSSLQQPVRYVLKIESFRKKGGQTFYNVPSKAKKVAYNPSLIDQNKKDRVLGSLVKPGGKYVRATYSDEVKEAYINGRKLGSPTPYLIFISNYTEQATIFHNVDGRWKVMKASKIANGKKWKLHFTTSIKYKEPRWWYSTTQVKYISHFYKKNSFHTVILNHDGSVSNGTIGRPMSHGCVRCPVSFAKYIYDNIPVGTTVVGY